MRLRVVTANVASSLGRTEARAALATVLAEEPDVVGLQEWYAVRRDLLPRGAWAWRAPLLGGCAVGVRRGVLDLVGGGRHALSRPGRADRGEGRWDLEPGRAVAVARCRGPHGPLAVVSYHLVSGVQRHDEYRPDRPRLVARHRTEHAALTTLVERLREQGPVVAMGDSNLHGFTLPGLASAWDGRPGGGTLGPRRRVDDVLGTGEVLDVRLLETGSDHRAVVVDLEL